MWPKYYTQLILGSEFYLCLALFIPKCKFISSPKQFFSNSQANHWSNFSMKWKFGLEADKRVCSLLSLLWLHVYFRAKSLPTQKLLSSQSGFASLPDISLLIYHSAYSTVYIYTYELSLPIPSQIWTLHCCCCSVFQRILEILATVSFLYIPSYLYSYFLSLMAMLGGRLPSIPWDQRGPAPNLAGSCRGPGWKKKHPLPCPPQNRATASRYSRNSLFSLTRLLVRV